MNWSDALAAVFPVIEALQRLGIRYYVAGSLASSAYGVARMTLDVDLIADLAPQHVAALVAALQGDYYVDAGMIARAIAQRSCFNVIHLATMFKVDVFMVKDREYDGVALERVRPDALWPEDPRIVVAVASPEDVVLNQLEWFRLGDEVSERQWRDVLGVLKVQKGALDQAYLAHWAERLGVAELLERAWREAET